MAVNKVTKLSGFIHFSDLLHTYIYFFLIIVLETKVRKKQGLAS